MRPSRVFVRFVILTPDSASGHRQGLFQAMSDLNRSGALSVNDQLAWDELKEWFNRNLDRLARASRAHARNAALSWFRSDAAEHISRMRQIAAILEAHDRQVEMIRSDRLGYVVYEDEHQVAAEPFRDTGA